MPLEAGHWERQQTPLRRLSRRELRLLVIAGAALLALVAAVALYAVVRNPAPARAGCIDVTIASTTGGARARACGADATRWCREEAMRNDRVARAVQARCRALALSRRSARP